MKTLYLECKMGAAGDMLGAAILGLFDDSEAIVNELNTIGIDGVEYKLEITDKCGIQGNHLRVLVHGKEELPDDIHEGHDHSNASQHDVENHQDHAHRTLYEIEDIIENMNLDKEIKSDIREVYELIAEAESSVHGVAVDKIHFHEVGDMDAIADITATCYLMHKLSPDKIIVSPINVGSGVVKTAHGILPVPAPATAHLLMEIPYYESEVIKSELCTPTGAALIKYFADEYSAQPVMTVKKIGYGTGNKDFPQANVLRAVLGETTDESEYVLELICNIDDMTAEEIGFATEMLFEAGALEVYTIAADMKKNRPGTLLYCVCKQDSRELMIEKIFKYTTTLGIRENVCNRYVLAREVKKIDTPYGEVRKKYAYGYNVTRSKLEYEDLAGIARRTGKSIIDLKKEIEE
ncbi:nickel pincer cofactor biosynthesis protein LarC [Butyrivibrio sp. VCB2006]|uniref:nickel pincer cofactor biosynthesis protein LarC n=1 Tax=Butyrivibrio sp. VCB2006 TaxID=1280679 RepID=UPI00040C91A3|nr:nickel pincer cofactor biosynthesis protein LarC [Butyrivibrio sp. VCB2006]